MKDRIITTENLKPGDTFRLFRELYHFVGTVQGDEVIYICWHWNKYKRRRVYTARPEWAFKIDLEYAKK